MYRPRGINEISFSTNSPPAAYNQRETYWALRLVNPIAISIRRSDRDLEVDLQETSARSERWC